MRGADFAASATFEQIARHRLGDPDLVRSELIRQRRELLDRLTAPGDLVAVPAHASRDLVDVIKRSGRQVVFASIGPAGATELPDDRVAAVWHQTVAGVHAPGPAGPDTAPVVLVDAHDTVVLAEAPGVAGIALTDASEPSLGGSPAAARQLVAAQIERLDAIAEGLRGAAGLPLIDPVGDATNAGPVPTGVVVRLPDDSDPLTFAAYAQAELTGIEWFAMRRPIHPQARRHLTAEQLRASLDHLSRLFIVPVSPVATDEEIGHAVLGVVKTAEYTGWRWHDDPDHAGSYADAMTQRYGPDHEAYRPAFPT